MKTEGVAINKKCAFRQAGLKTSTVGNVSRAINIKVSNGTPSDKFIPPQLATFMQLLETRIHDFEEVHFEQHKTT